MKSVEYRVMLPMRLQEKMPEDIVEIEKPVTLLIVSGITLQMRMRTLSNTENTA